MYHANFIKVKTNAYKKIILHRQPKEQEKHLQKYLITDVYSEYIKNLNNSTVKKIPINIKMGKQLNIYFPKEDTQMIHKCMKNCSVSLVNRQMQIKNTMRYCYIPTRLG